MVMDTRGRLRAGVVGGEFSRGLEGLSMFRYPNWWDSVTKRNRGLRKQTIIYQQSKEVGEI